MGVLFNKIGLKLILKGVYKAITGFGSVEDSLYDEDLWTFWKYETKI